jgi:amino-acid N-acetyltransferase
MIRPATIHDVPRIQEIINSHAELGKMLFKSLAQLYESMRDFAVVEINHADAARGEVVFDNFGPISQDNMDAEETRSSQGKIVGCVGLSIIWADLAEVRSLAVDDEYRGQGIGRQLVEWTVQEARRLQIRRLMALTYEQKFFEKIGFEVVAKESLPLKVWSDCVRCPKKVNCDEIAMVRFLQDVPMILMHQAPPTPRGVSIPVLQEMVDD